MDDSVVDYLDMGITAHNNWSKTQFSVNIFFESFEESLKEHIQKHSNFFTETEMVRFIYKGLKFLNDLELR